MLKELRSKIDNDSNFKELLSGSAITFILKISGMFLGYVAIYLVSKKNGADGVGYYSLISQMLFILGLFAAMGTNTSILRFVGKYNNDEERSKIKGIYKSVLSIITLLSITTSLILYFFSDQLALTFFKDKSYSEAIRLVAFFLTLFVIDRVAVEFIRGLKKLMISEFIRTVSKPLILIICLLLFWNQNIENIYIAYFVCAAVLINFILSNTTVLLFISKIRGKSNDQVSTKEILKISSPMMISDISGALINSVSIFMLEYFSTTENVGIYTICFSIAQIVSIVIVVINTIAAPKFAELYWAKKYTELQKIVRQSTKVMFWAALGIAAALSLSGYWFLLFFGENFTTGTTTLIILIGLNVVNAASGSVGFLLNMSAHQNTRRNTGLVSLGIQIILAVILIPHYGIIGAAISTAVGASVWNLLCVFYVKKHLGIKSYYFFK